jgi:hypothetical protein
MSADFSILMLEQYTTSAMSWTQSIGCLLCIYGYFISSKKLLWTVLLVHGISGFFGTLFENIFNAKQICCSNENWAYLLGINELLWIVHESSTVFYSMVKLEPIITTPSVRRALRWVLFVCLVGFSSFRILIGVYRIQSNTVRNEMIDQAHSLAFIFWGISDLILFGLLIKNTVQYLQSNSEQLHFLVSKLFQSSLPRIFVIILNTFLLVVLSQLNISASIEAIFWAVKGTYPVSLIN